MSIDTVITLSIVAVAAALVVRGGLASWRKNLSGGSGCGGCGGCDDGGPKDPGHSACSRPAPVSGRVHLPVLRNER